jgi:hypothetical protein
MGFLDFLKTKPKNKNRNIDSALVNYDDGIEIKTDFSNKEIMLFFEDLRIPENIRNLLWFADGKYQNYNPDENKQVLFENELFRIELSFGTEPSLLYSNLPIKPNSTIDLCESIGYFPSYESLAPEQRWIYLNWLTNILQPVDIGYVFIFYYGLERHLLYGNYKESVDTILLLREHHKNNSFYSYSFNAVLLASLLHKDKDTFEKVLKSSHDIRLSNIGLIAKYLMKINLTPEEIIALSSAAGFKNKRYIKNYPEIFQETLSSQLKSIFGTASFPFYNLNTKFEIKDMLIFANTSLSSNMRSPSLPTIIDNDDFKQSLYNILSTTHKAVKKQIGDMRKAGDKPASAVLPPNDSAIKEKEINVTCPYCKTLLDEAPKRKKKCPHCDNNIYVKPKQNLFSSIYLTEEQVIELNEYESIEHFNDKRKEEKSRLLNYKRSSVFENVKISSHGGCEACQELHGKIFTIDEALKEMPIPNKECTFKLHGEIPRYCRCRYVPLYE